MYQQRLSQKSEAGSLLWKHLEVTHGLSEHSTGMAIPGQISETLSSALGVRREEFKSKAGMWQYCSSILTHLAGT